MGDYPYSILEEKVNNLGLKLIGVRHTQSFFDEHKGFFEEEINKSKAIFFEQSVIINEWPDDDVAAFEGSPFYEKLAELAKINGIPIYIPDCANIYSGPLDIVQMIAGFIFLRRGKKVDQNMPRRMFLKGLGAYLLLSTVGKTVLDVPKYGSDIAIDDALLYDSLLDYRNIVSAENIEKASKVLELEGQAPFFIGQCHIKGIHAYLKHPMLRKKRIVYLPQDLIHSTSLKKYAFKEGCWRLTEKI